MLEKLLVPKVDLASLCLRLGLAAIFAVHGYFKVIQDDPLIVQLSMETNLLVGWVELVCGLLLGIGLLSRLAALAIIPVQVTAILMITGKKALDGPAIVATGADYTHVGPEFNLVLIAMCLGVILLGSGMVSLDHFLASAWRRKTVQAATPAPAIASAEVTG